MAGIKWGGFCCQAPPRAPPQLARAEDLGAEKPALLTQRELDLQQSCRWQLLQWASVGAQAGKVFAFTRPSILCRPQTFRPTTGRNLVEPPGTAPGSGPLITRGFIAIVPCGTTSI